ncbi:MAG TPA: GNAT family N-acetyltransferase [Methanothermobacter sp.]|nr:putative acetyltransferase [Methanothermobacter sp. MT-2]HHW05008.1 GNAT family N-acetyltransferase [Methanothermobacter sp.]HOK72514.1 GNAT family N-acetyltransferase [Methanothermobacter sp.]HOL69423.1 GNAT family N-acetyltransferase [Methanothermobacter sp.]HPQ04001.1 GNAT family N-acetyltransferase [Methanothermobacter sp.]
MNIRNVKEEDFIKIAKLAKKCHPMAIERNSIYHLFTKFFSNTSFIAEENQRIIGFLLGFVSQDNPKEAYIHLLCVHPRSRRNGIASKLLEKFINKVKKVNVKKISLITKPINKRAISFYKKHGFREYKGPETCRVSDVNVFKDYNGEGEDMVLFEKSVK